MKDLREFALETKDDKIAFLPGEIVRGELYLCLEEPVEIKSIKVFLVGEGEGAWIRQVSPDKTVSRKNNRELIKKHYLINIGLIAFGYKEEDKTQTETHESGRYVYEFEFDLPPYLPPTFRSPGDKDLGFARYFLKAIMSRPKKHDREIRQRIVINELLDPERPELSFQPGKFEEKNVKSLCMPSGTISLESYLNRANYTQGEKVLINALAENKSSKVMKELYAVLIRRVHNKSRYGTTTYTTEETRINGARIPANERLEWKEHPLTVPPVGPTITGNKDIRVDYIVRVGMYEDLGSELHLDLPVVIGTVGTREEIDQQNAYEEEESQHNLMDTKREKYGLKLIKAKDRGNYRNALELKRYQDSDAKSYNDRINVSQENYDMDASLDDSIILKSYDDNTSRFNRRQSGEIQRSSSAPLQRGRLDNKYANNKYEKFDEKKKGYSPRYGIVTKAKDNNAWPSKETSRKYRDFDSGKDGNKIFRTSGRRSAEPLKESQQQQSIDSQSGSIKRKHISKSQEAISNQKDNSLTGNRSRRESFGGSERELNNNEVDFMGSKGQLGESAIPLSGSFDSFEHKKSSQTSLKGSRKLDSNTAQGKKKTENRSHIKDSEGSRSKTNLRKSSPSIFENRKSQEVKSSERPRRDSDVNKKKDQVSPSAPVGILKKSKESLKHDANESRQPKQGFQANQMKADPKVQDEVMTATNTSFHTSADDSFDRIDATAREKIKASKRNRANSKESISKNRADSEEKLTRNQRDSKQDIPNNRTDNKETPSRKGTDSKENISRNRADSKESFPRVDQKYLADSKKSTENIVEISARHPDSDEATPMKPLRNDNESKEENEDPFYKKGIDKIKGGIRSLWGGNTEKTDKEEDSRKSENADKNLSIDEDDLIKKKLKAKEKRGSEELDEKRDPLNRTRGKFSETEPRKLSEVKRDAAIKERRLSDSKITDSKTIACSGETFQPIKASEKLTNESDANSNVKVIPFNENGEKIEKNSTETSGIKERVSADKSEAKRSVNLGKDTANILPEKTSNWKKPGEEIAENRNDKNTLTKIPFDKSNQQKVRNNEDEVKKEKRDNQISKETGTKDATAQPKIRQEDKRPSSKESGYKLYKDVIDGVIPPDERLPERLNLLEDDTAKLGEKIQQEKDKVKENLQKKDGLDDRDIKQNDNKSRKSSESESEKNESFLEKADRKIKEIFKSPRATENDSERRDSLGRRRSFKDFFKSSKKSEDEGESSISNASVPQNTIEEQNKSDINKGQSFDEKAKQTATAEEPKTMPKMESRDDKQTMHAGKKGADAGKKTSDERHKTNKSEQSLDASHDDEYYDALKSPVSDKTSEKLDPYKDEIRKNEKKIQPAKVTSHHDPRDEESYLKEFEKLEEEMKNENDENKNMTTSPALPEDTYTPMSPINEETDETESPRKKSETEISPSKKRKFTEKLQQKRETKPSVTKDDSDSEKIEGDSSFIEKEMPKEGGKGNVTFSSDDDLLDRSGDITIEELKDADKSAEKADTKLNDSELEAAEEEQRRSKSPWQAVEKFGKWLFGIKEEDKDNATADDQQRKGKDGENKADNKKPLNKKTTADKKDISKRGVTKGDSKQTNNKTAATKTGQKPVSTGSITTSTRKGPESTSKRPASASTKPRSPGSKPVQRSPITNAKAKTSVSPKTTPKTKDAVNSRTKPSEQNKNTSIKTQSPKVTTKGKPSPTLERVTSKTTKSPSDQRKNIPLEKTQTAKGSPATPKKKQFIKNNFQSPQSSPIRSRHDSKAKKSSDVTDGSPSHDPYLSDDSLERLDTQNIGPTKDNKTKQSPNRSNKRRIPQPTKDASKSSSASDINKSPFDSLTSTPKKSASTKIKPSPLTVNQVETAVQNIRKQSASSDDSFYSASEYDDDNSHKEKPRHEGQKQITSPNRRIPEYKGGRQDSEKKRTEHAQTAEKRKPRTSVSTEEERQSKLTKSPSFESIEQQIEPQSVSERPLHPNERRPHHNERDDDEGYGTINRNQSKRKTEAKAGKRTFAPSASQQETPGEATEKSTPKKRPAKKKQNEIDDERQGRAAPSWRDSLRRNDSGSKSPIKRPAWNDSVRIVDPTPPRERSLDSSSSPSANRKNNTRKSTERLGGLSRSVSSPMVNRKGRDSSQEKTSQHSTSTERLSNKSSPKSPGLTRKSSIKIKRSASDSRSPVVVRKRNSEAQNRESETTPASDQFDRDTVPDKYERDMVPNKYDRDTMPGKHVGDTVTDKYARDAATDKYPRDTVKDKYDRDTVPDKHDREVVPDRFERGTSPDGYDRNTVPEKYIRDTSLGKYDRDTGPEKYDGDDEQSRTDGKPDRANEYFPEQYADQKNQSGNKMKQNFQQETEWKEGKPTAKPNYLDEKYFKPHYDDNVRDSHYDNKLSPNQNDDTTISDDVFFESDRTAENLKLPPTPPKRQNKTTDLSNRFPLENDTANATDDGDMPETVVSYDRATHQFVYEERSRSTSPSKENRYKSSENITRSSSGDYKKFYSNRAKSHEELSTRQRTTDPYNKIYESDSRRKTSSKGKENYKRENNATVSEKESSPLRGQKYVDHEQHNISWEINWENENEKQEDISDKKQKQLVKKDNKDSSKSPDAKGDKLDGKKQNFDGKRKEWQKNDVDRKSIARDSKQTTDKSKERLERSKPTKPSNEKTSKDSRLNEIQTRSNNNAIDRTRDTKTMQPQKDKKEESSIAAKEINETKPVASRHSQCVPDDVKKEGNQTSPKGNRQVTDQTSKKQKSILKQPREEKAREIYPGVFYKATGNEMKSPIPYEHVKNKLLKETVAEVTDEDMSERSSIRSDTDNSLKLPSPPTTNKDLLKANEKPQKTQSSQLRKQDSKEENAIVLSVSANKQSKSPRGGAMVPAIDYTKHKPYSPHDYKEDYEEDPTYHPTPRPDSRSSQTRSRASSRDEIELYSKERRRSGDRQRTRSEEPRSSSYDREFSKTSEQTVQRKYSDGYPRTISSGQLSPSKYSENNIHVNSRGPILPYVGYIERKDEEREGKDLRLPQTPSKDSDIETVELRMKSKETNSTNLKLPAAPLSKANVPSTSPLILPEIKAEPMVMEKPIAYEIRFDNNKSTGKPKDSSVRKTYPEKRNKEPYRPRSISPSTKPRKAQVYRTRSLSPNKDGHLIKTRPIKPASYQQPSYSKQTYNSNSQKKTPQKDNKTGTVVASQKSQKSKNVTRKTTPSGSTYIELGLAKPQDKPRRPSNDDVTDGRTRDQKAYDDRMLIGGGLTFHTSPKHKSKAPKSPVKPSLSSHPKNTNESIQPEKHAPTRNQETSKSPKNISPRKTPPLYKKSHTTLSKDDSKSPEQCDVCKGVLPQNIDIIDAKPKHAEITHHIAIHDRRTEMTHEELLWEEKIKEYINKNKQIKGQKTEDKKLILPQTSPKESGNEIVLGIKPTEKSANEREIMQLMKRPMSDRRYTDKFTTDQENKNIPPKSVVRPIEQQEKRQPLEVENVHSSSYTAPRPTHDLKQRQQPYPLYLSQTKNKNLSRSMDESFDSFEFHEQSLGIVDEHGRAKRNSQLLQISQDDKDNFQEYKLSLGQRQSSYPELSESSEKTQSKGGSDEGFGTHHPDDGVGSYVKHSRPDSALRHLPYDYEEEIIDTYKYEESEHTSVKRENEAEMDLNNSSEAIDTTPLKRSVRIKVNKRIVPEYSNDDVKYYYE